MRARVQGGRAPHSSSRFILNRPSNDPTTRFAFSLYPPLSAEPSVSSRFFISSLDNNPGDGHASFRIKIPYGLVHAGVSFLRHDLFSLERSYVESLRRSHGSGYFNGIISLYKDF